MSVPAVGRPMEILLVEDGLVDAKFTMAALKKAGIRHRLTLVRDGEEALEFLRREGMFARAPRPDLILLDLHLPKKGGLEVLDEIRSDDQLRSIPVVIMTASDDAEDRQKSEHLNVDYYITKPVDLEKFLDAVKQLKKYWLHDLILPM